MLFFLVRKSALGRCVLQCLLTSVLLVAACPLAAQPPLEFPLEARRILFVGDSITHHGGYVAWIDGQLRLQGVDPKPEIINIGLGSETCCGLTEPDHPFPRPDVHERLGRALERLKPDVVVACYGMNDGIYHPFSGERFTAYQKGIRKLIERVHAAGAKIVVVTPPPFDPLPIRDRLQRKEKGPFGYKTPYHDYEGVLRRYAKWIMSLGDEADMVVDIHTPLVQYVTEQRKKDPNFTLARDGVHPGPTGHRLMAEAILQAWGVQASMEPPQGLMERLQRRTRLWHDAWLTAIGHQHPRVGKGPSLKEARAAIDRLDGEIAPLVKKARETRLWKRRSDSGTVWAVAFPPTARPKRLRLAVEYDLWVPDGVKQLRGIIVHQHGCGPGASLAGKTAADDLHWQALARKWDCALLGSSYEPRRGIHCRLWCDPRQGSARQFVHGLEELARASGHNEVATVPWCLWGHSGGGFWSSLMQTLYPERIVAIWLRSGTAYYAWRDGQIEMPTFPPAMFGIPVLANPGAAERDHRRFHVGYEGLVQMRQEYLKKGAPFFEFAADPRTGHECGDSRYLAIPYFDFWLEHRLPPKRAGDTSLRPVNDGVLAEWKKRLEPKVAAYRESGSVPDTTPPPAPAKVTMVAQDDGSVRLEWYAEADFESGIGGFRILRDGKVIAQLPKKPSSRFGRALFQGLSYHDTPVSPIPEMVFVDRPPAGAKRHYAVQTVNSVGLVSQPTAAR